jgi:hypothetical protein
MPVLLSGEDPWLYGSPAEAFSLARSFDPMKMRIVQCGLRKHLTLQLHRPPHSQSDCRVGRYYILFANKPRSR